ncbi:MAG: hypothetical protein F6J87_16750 [Spirulina sp. SIO3F2]|nr:hypothetical protein [Spirulina sp. SIO3F2]
MSLSTQRTIFSAGLATLAFALAPAAQAQIQVNGGVIDGQAAFFTPDNLGAGNPISLFDLQISNLQIVSPNGVLTNPDFTPTASGGFIDVDNSAGTAAGSVTNGDTGLIVGKLSGIGFTSEGAVVPFSNVETALAYRVTNFNVTNTFADGFLVDGANIPQLFFTQANDPTPVATGFTAVEGDLEVGDFNSNITSGVIDLPSTLQISSTGGNFGSVFNFRVNDSSTSFTNVEGRALANSDAEIENTDDGTNTPTNITFNFSSITVNFSTTATFTVNGSSDFSTFTTSTSTESDTAATLIQEVLDDLDIESISDNTTLTIFSSSSRGGRRGRVRYQVASSPTIKIKIKERRDGSIKVKIKVKNNRGRRYIVAQRGDISIGFVQRGPSSRMIPGFSGLDRLSEEETADILALIQADEAADADADAVDDTDTDTDTDVSDGDDDGDDVADDDGDDDGDDVADDDGDDDGGDVADDDGDDDAGDDVADDGTPDEGAAFQGLDSIDPGETTPGVSGDGADAGATDGADADAPN